jgi:hypothetical protein
MSMKKDMIMHCQCDARLRNLQVVSSDRIEAHHPMVSRMTRSPIRHSIKHLGVNVDGCSFLSAIELLSKRRSA